MLQNYYFPIVFTVVFLLTYIGVQIFRKWSLYRGLFDVPNERSSHTNPTPRGGGIVIVFICLIFYTISTLLVFETFSIAYVGGAIVIAFISWLDDLYDVSFLIRILIHSLAALLIVYFVGYFEYFYLPIFGQIINKNFVGAIVTFLWILWLTNAFNFMDGIDGIAGMQTVTAGFGWMAIGLFFGLMELAFYGGVLASAGLGFLILNWQPSKLFMGDVGSAFLGYTFAALPLLSFENKNPVVENLAMLPILALLVNWFFIFDTVYTMFRRLLRKEKIWKAHRRHLYQQMVIAGYEHQSATILYGSLSILIILTVFIRLFLGKGMDLVMIFFTVMLTVGLTLFVNYASRKGKISTNQH